jgi:hypothetical protein
MVKTMTNKSFNSKYAFRPQSSSFTLSDIPTKNVSQKDIQSNNLRKLDDKMLKNFHIYAVFASR